MGTSTPFGGPNGGTPLVPSWLDGASSPTSTIPPVADRGRFQGVRSNVTRLAQSGGTDRARLGKSVSGYVGSSGGSKKAAQRMKVSASVGTGFVNFFSAVASQGANQALQTFSLSHLVGRPLSEVFVGLAEQICPLGGTIDEGIARNAFIETIGLIEDLGVVDLNKFTVEEMNVFFELYVANSIKLRLYNDVATKIIMIPSSISAVIDIEAQLFDFIRAGVSAAINNSSQTIPSLSSPQYHSYVESVYQSSFEFLVQLSQTEEDL